MAENTIVSVLQRSLLTPVKALKKRYIPLLLIYFAYGTQAITGVALTFWEKENLSLSAEDLVALGVWVSLPFTVKMIFGQLIDILPLFGSRRRAWVFLGAALMTLGYLMLYGMSTNSPYMTWMGSQFTMYLAAQLMMVLGFVVQDVTADAMTTEVVDRDQPDDAIKADLAMVQVLGRLSLMVALAISGGLGGYLADKLSYDSVFLIALVIPLISILGALFVTLDAQDTSSETLSPTIFGGGIALAVFSVVMGFSNFGFSQELTFLTTFTLICWMLSTLLKGQDKTMIKSIVLTFTALFVFRATPSVGPGYSWFAIDELGFDQAFFGTLRTFGGFAALIVLWFASDFIAKKSIRAVLILLIILGTILSLPDIALYYGIHDKIGVSAKTIALLDTMAESPLVHMSMIPMLSLIAYYAPAGQRATWFAVSASLMNLATTGGSILTKYLNKLFVVSREVKDNEGIITTAADYSQLGPLLWVSISAAFIVPLIVVFLCLKKPKEA